MNEYAKRKEVLGKYEGIEIPNPLKNTPGPEMINFDASGFVTLRYNYKENENEFKCREVRLYLFIRRKRT